MKEYFNSVQLRRIYVDWIYVTLGSEGALVNAVMNFSGSIKCWKVLEYMPNWWLLRKGSAPSVRGSRVKGLPLILTIITF
jgi:hypothetical protein